MVADEITLQKVSISRIKQEMRDVYYLSDDLVIASFDIHRDTLGNYPALIDGFSAIIMASGSAVVAIDTEEYEVVPDTIVFFSPDRVIRTVASTSDAAAYFVACSKSFINEIQIDLSASLPVYMRFGKQPCLRVTPQDTHEIRQVFQLIKTILASDKEHYRQEIIRCLFTAVFYIITELNMREQKNTVKLGRGEVNVQNANGDVNEQISQIEYFIEKKMDVIVVVATDCDALGDVMREAKNAGIKTVSYDRLISNGESDLYVSFNNIQVGRLMAESLVENIPEGGEVFLIQGPLTDDNVRKVRQGIDEVLAGTNLKVVYEANCDGWLAEQAYDYVKEGLQQTRNVKGIICGNDDLASHAFRRLSEERLAGKVVLTGQDGDLAACQRIVSGTQEMTAFKSVEEEARLAAEYVVKLGRGESIDDIEKTANDGAYDVDRKSVV